MNFSAIPIIKIVMKAFIFFFVVTLKNSNVTSSLRQEIISCKINSGIIEVTHIQLRFTDFISLKPVLHTHCLSLHF